MHKLEIMLAELESSQLVTILVPCPRPMHAMHCKRVNVSESPKWYKSYCRQHSSKRGVRRGKQDTICRRQHTIAALNYLINHDGKPRPQNPGHRRLLEFAGKYKI